MLLIPAHAKINLCLALRRRRSDGYHEIDSVAATIDWHDLVGVRIAAAASTTVQLRVTSDGRDETPPGEGNLAWRAAAAMAALHGPLSIDIWLHKRVPQRAGLGGGSADAAAVLAGINVAVARMVGRADPRPLEPAALGAVAASLGSDVPALLAGGVQRMRGRGELLTPLRAGPLQLVVAVAGGSDTGATYAAAGDADHDHSTRVDDVVAAITEGRRPAADDLGSGLEAAARRASPLLGKRLDALRAVIPSAGWHLTGSGGAAFALADDAGHARQLAADAQTAGFLARACRTVGPLR